MEEVGIIDLKQRLFDPGHVDLPGDHLLQDAAVSQISLQQGADDDTVLGYHLFIDPVLVIGIDSVAVIGRRHNAQGHRVDAQKAHG